MSHPPFPSGSLEPATTDRTPAANSGTDAACRRAPLAPTPDRPNRRGFLLGATCAIALGLKACMRSSPATATPPESHAGALDAAIAGVGELSDPPADDLDQVIRTYDQQGFRCSVHERQFAKPLLNLPLLDPNGDVLFLGNILQGATLDAVPASLPADRSGGTLVLSNLNGSQFATASVDRVSLASVTTQMNQLLAAQQGRIPAQFEVHVEQVRATEELQIRLEAHGSYFGLFSARSGFRVQQSSEYRSFLVTIRQVFYAANFERPSAHAHGFFAESMQVADLAPNMGPGNPPVYISNIAYGRVFYLLVQARESAEEMEATLTANFVFGAAGGSLGHVSRFAGVTVDAFAYGGDANAMLRAALAGVDQLNTFKEELVRSVDLLTGLPLRYTVRYLTSDRVMKVGLATDYEYVDCVRVGQCIPNLQEPGAGARLPNGCRNEQNAYAWTFRVQPCADATEYAIEVRNPSVGVVVNYAGGAPEVVYRDSLAYERTDGWLWRARAKVAGAWSEWTADRGFSLDPPDQRCDTGGDCWKDFEYVGRRTRVNEDIPDLEAWASVGGEFSSCRLHNVRGVTFYAGRNYTGRQAYIDHDCPNLRDHLGHEVDNPYSLRIHR